MSHETEPLTPAELTTVVEAPRLSSAFKVYGDGRAEHRAHIAGILAKLGHELDDRRPVRHTCDSPDESARNCQACYGP